MVARQGRGFAGAWLFLAALATSCGGISRKSDATPAAGPDDGVAGSGGRSAGTAGTAAAQSVAGAPQSPAAGAPAQDGGAPGPEPCIQGQACSVEDSQCTDDSGCCVIRDVCSMGRWTELEHLGPCKNDPPAPAFVCSSTPPIEGSACGSCHVECSYNSCSPQGGKNFVAQCVDGKWEYADQGCLTCCQTDADCPNGMCVQSRCESLDHGTGCFRDSECKPAQICGGAQIAPCGTAPKLGDQNGVCVPAGLGCCATNADCKSAEVCLAGVCKPPAPAGKCWRDADCSIGCGGVSVCPCGSSCFAPDTPGECLVPL